MNYPTKTYAIVRDVPSTFDRAIRPPGAHQPIDVARAQAQHHRYCETLEGLGVRLIRLPPDVSSADCCFVEDTAIVVGDRALITHMGAEARRCETSAVEAVLSGFKKLERLQPPANLDGGDVLAIGQRIWVGLSSRSNRQAAERVRALFAPDGYEVQTVRVRRALHLKSVCSHVGGELMLALSDHLDERAFRTMNRIVVPPEESHAANCLSLRGTVLVASGAPRTRRAIEQAGFATQEVDLSELRKAAGALTCCSLIFEASPA